MCLSYIIIRPAASQRWHPTGTPSPRPVHTSCVYTIFTLAIIMKEQREGRLLAGPGLGAREARFIRLRQRALGRGRRGRARRAGLARGRSFGTLLRRRRRGLVVHTKGAAPAQEGLEAVLPDRALRRVEAEGRFRGRRVGGVLEDGPALDDGALLVVRVHDLCENRYAIEQTQSRGVEKFDFHAVTTVRGEEMCWRESWGRCIVFQRGRRLRPGEKKVPRAFWTASFVGLAMAEVP